MSECGALVESGVFAVRSQVLSSVNATASVTQQAGQHGALERGVRPSPLGRRNSPSLHVRLVAAAQQQALVRGLRVKVRRPRHMDA